MAIKFVIDSASDIQLPGAAALGLTRLPLTVSFDGEEYQDGVDLSPREFYEKLIESDCLRFASPDDAAMQEEIFGPVLPVILYDTLEEAIAFINARPHPLACYLFTEDRRVKQHFLAKVPFGGGCINDTIIHLATSRMGFGGVGGSGMGSYHGKKSFETFSHEKSIVDKSTWMDLPVRYAPYTSLQYKLLRFFLR